MRAASTRARLALGVIASTAILLSAPADGALAASEVRLLHAVPGGPAAELAVSGGEGSGEAVLSGAVFGEATDYASAPQGEVTLTLAAAGRELGGVTERLGGGGRYTVLAAPGSGGSAQLTVLRDAEAVPGRTRWRMVHAAPELDEADFELSDRAVGSLAKGEASRYTTVEPGAHAIAARRPGGGDALVEDPAVNLVAGTAQTAYLVGSGGERTRFVVLQDSVAAPSVAPATGLGGLDRDGRAWLTAALAALLAGVLGAGAYVGARRRLPRART